MVLRLFTAWIFFVFVCAPPSASLAQNEGLDREEMVKLSYIYNFAKFVQWPEGHDDAGQSFVICGLGEGALHSGLHRLASEAKINNRTILVLLNPSQEKISDCHILYIDSSKEKLLETILSQVGNRPILTVGDTPGYGNRGVALNLFGQSGKIKFEVNMKSIRRSGLTVSSQLLELGKMVEEDK